MSNSMGSQHGIAAQRKPSHKIKLNSQMNRSGSTSGEKRLTRRCFINFRSPDACHFKHSKIHCTVFENGFNYTFVLRMPMSKNHVVQKATPNANLKRLSWCIPELETLSLVFPVMEMPTLVFPLWERAEMISRDLETPTLIFPRIRNATSSISRLL